MSDVGRYRKIYPRLWRHPGFKALKPSARELVLYLLTGPQTNAIGLFHFSVATAAEDLNVGTETIRKGLADISVTFDWRFDADARVIFIPSWWHWNKPENANVLTGNIKALSEIPPCGLVDAFTQNTETLPATLLETFVERCRIRLPKRSPIQEHDQEHLSVTEHKHARARAKDGSDGSSQYLPVAREALSLNHRDAPISVLVDTFRTINKDSLDKAEVIRLIQIARHERT